MQVNSTEDFRRWVKMQMLLMDTTQRKLAAEMGISYPRISEALHGKASGKKYVIPIINALGGDLADFKTFLDSQ